MPLIGLALMIISCAPQEKQTPLALYAELDENAPVNTLTEKEKGSSWELLFNGTDFTGWHGYNMDTIPDCWIIEDQALTMTTVGGAESQDIITDKKYRNFAFAAEFKLTEAANSGIIFQVEEDSKYQFPYETGPEFQVIDHENWPDSLADWQICGANYAMYPKGETLQTCRGVEPNFAGGRRQQGDAYPERRGCGGV